MAGGGNDALFARWKDVLLAAVADRAMRGNVIGVALVFAELAGCAIAWNRHLEGFDVRESQVIKEWEVRGGVKVRRQYLLDVLAEKFSGAASEEVIRLINEQDSADLLRDWFRAALRAPTYDEFLAVLRQ